MKNHEVPFNDAKKDGDGFAKILVRFGDWAVPILAKPELLTKDDIDAVLEDKDSSRNEKIEEVKRLNLTRWILKDIPEVAKLTSKLADGKASWLFYYNGNEGTWKFWDAPFAGIDEDGDDFDEKIVKLDKLIDKMEDELYCPHLDHEGNYGDESIHAVYASDLKSIHTGTLVENAVRNAIAQQELCRKKHKKIPYFDIGLDFMASIAGVGPAEIGKALARTKLAI